MSKLNEQIISGFQHKPDGEVFFTDAIEQEGHSHAKSVYEHFMSQSYAPLEIVSDKNALEEINAAKEHLDAFNNFLIIGTGGSSLGGKMLCGLSKNNLASLNFIENTDFDTIEQVIKDSDPKKTAIIAISKSGETAETLSVFSIFYQWLQSYVGESAYKQCLIITEDKTSSLKTIAAQEGIYTLNHHLEIGGRYSVFSNVGLLPALLSGLNIDQILMGAEKCLNEFKSEANNHILQGALYNFLFLKHHQKTSTVMLYYADRLNYLGLWFRQLWAESIGKSGKGSNPVPALGTVDQHSQLQLWLDGPKDKIFTVITLDQKQKGQAIHFSDCPEKINYLEGKTIGDLMDAEQRAITQVLKENNCPVREIRLPHLDEETMGGLLMQFMIETILMADFLDVNPFDQPAVEQGKILTKQYLS